MRRREFISLLGGTAVSWPRLARAQQPERMRRVGVLMNTAESNAEGQTRLAAFRQRLQELGWTEGRNVRIDVRWGGGDVDRIRRHAAELVGLSPDVLLAYANAQLGALARETRAVPIVFIGVSDPVGAGYVASFARPGGNITGFTLFEAISGRQVAGDLEGDRSRDRARRRHGEPGHCAPARTTVRPRIQIRGCSAFRCGHHCACSQHRRYRSRPPLARATSRRRPHRVARILHLELIAS